MLLLFLPRGVIAGLSLTVALVACTPAPSSDTATAVAEASRRTAEAAAPAAIPAATATAATASLGTYTVGDSVVTLVDAVVIRNVANELQILYTPTPLSEEERKAVLAKPEWPGMALANKTGGAFPDRYPYVVASFRYEGTPTRENTRTFHLLAYGIQEKNYTDNVNGPVNDLGYTLERLDVQGDRVSLAFHGATTFGDVPRRWAIDTPY